MPRGGARKGTAGQAYGNRRDLSNAVNQAPPKIPVAPPAPPVGQGSPVMRPDDVKGLFAPDDHPEVPLTAGLPGGAGPGPEALPGMGLQDKPGVAELRAIYMKYPYEGIRRMLDAYR